MLQKITEQTMSKDKRTMALLLPLMLNCSALSADDLRGTVVDAESGEPLVGATVVVNQKRGTLTDEAGHFCIADSTAALPSPICVTPSYTLCATKPW